MAEPPAEIRPGLWRWAARHPEWHPGRFGADVASFALETGDDVLLVDPLLPTDDASSVLVLLDELASRRSIHCVITIGYHVRSAEVLSARYSGRIWGPPHCRPRLHKRSLLTILEPGAPGPGGVTAFSIGRPPRGERPLWFPSHWALAFGDAIVTTPDGNLRIWAQQPLSPRRRRWYHETFAPTLAPLLDLPVQRILVTHGSPVLRDGTRVLREALAADPWLHRG